MKFNSQKYEIALFIWLEDPCRNGCGRLDNDFRKSLKYKPSQMDSSAERAEPSLAAYFWWKLDRACVEGLDPQGQN